ncbi:RHS repeat domain-containing protein [Capnocytophaga canimorsus]|uniref:RHS repeat domain-containing protein n=1 Tax=Capnocytophaga canimorsus TaxID=28188 RepID=UPI0037D39DB2
MDIYGKVRKETKETPNFVPFRYQGQYYDEEINLCYNRFRYYDCNTGTYISQDPIGLLGNNPNFYAYVFDSNTEVDVFGLDIDYKAVFFEAYPELKGKVWVHHSIERQVLKRYVGLFTEAEINELKMLRGIPKEVNADIHLSKIRMEWNDFYKKIDLGKVELTKENFLNKAKNIDDMFGEFFTPKIIKKSKICS